MSTLHRRKAGTDKLTLFLCDKLSQRRHRTSAPESFHLVASSTSLIVDRTLEYIPSSWSGGRRSKINKFRRNASPNQGNADKTQAYIHIIKTIHSLMNLRMSNQVGF